MDREIARAEMNELKTIVEELFNVSIIKELRTRETVEARMIFSKILRDRGYKFKAISVFLKKDHTTVVHYMSRIDIFMKHDRNLMDKYFLAKGMFMKDRKSIASKMSEHELDSKITALNNKIEELLLENEFILKRNERYNRIMKIIKVIDERTPMGEERFNGINYGKRRDRRGQEGDSDSD
jgi:hypothetical protein